MLKDWLDENLPALVERMVEKRNLPDFPRREVTALSRAPVDFRPRPLL